MQSFVARKSGGALLATNEFLNLVYGISNSKINVVSCVGSLEITIER